MAPDSPRNPDLHLDRDLLALYLNDHLAGATAGVGRAERMAEQYRDLPEHGSLSSLCTQLREERARLESLIGELGMAQSSWRQSLARVGEELGRLKLNRRLLARSPMSPLLEVELLRGAVNAKRGMWQVLTELSPALGLVADEWRQLDKQALEQSNSLDEVHAALAPHAFTEDSPLED